MSFHHSIKSAFFSLLRVTFSNVSTIPFKVTFYVSQFGALWLNLRAGRITLTNSLDVEKKPRFNFGQMKEIYTQYGCCMYHAQCLERQLAVLLASEERRLSETFGTAHYRTLFESLFRNTLGILLGRVRKRVNVSGDLESALTEALERRNWLAHDYFWKKVHLLETDEGRRSMIQELQNTAVFLARLNEQMLEITDEWGRRHSTIRRQRKRAITMIKIARRWMETAGQ